MSEAAGLGTEDPQQCSVATPSVWSCAHSCWSCPRPSAAEPGCTPSQSISSERERERKSKRKSLRDAVQDFLTAADLHLTERNHYSPLVQEHAHVCSCYDGDAWWVPGLRQALDMNSFPTSTPRSCECTAPQTPESTLRSGRSSSTARKCKQLQAATLADAPYQSD